MTSDYIDMTRELLGRMNTARNKIIMEQKKTNKINNNLFVELEDLLDIDKVLEYNYENRKGKSSGDIFLIMPIVLRILTYLN